MINLYKIKKKIGSPFDKSIFFSIICYYYVDVVQFLLSITIENKHFFRISSENKDFKTYVTCFLNYKTNSYRDNNIDILHGKVFLLRREQSI